MSSLSSSRNSASIDSKLGAYRAGRQYLCHAARRMFSLSVIQSALDFASNAYVHTLSQALYGRFVIKKHYGMKKVFGLPRRAPTSDVLSLCRPYAIENRFNLKLFVFYISLLEQPSQ